MNEIIETEENNYKLILLTYVNFILMELDQKIEIDFSSGILTVFFSMNSIIQRTI